MSFFRFFLRHSPLLRRQKPFAGQVKTRPTIRAVFHRRQLNLGEIMANRSLASHLREMWILRNNQAKIITGDNLGFACIALTINTIVFKRLTHCQANVTEAPLNCPVWAPISPLPVIVPDNSDIDQPVRGGTDLAIVHRSFSHNLVGRRLAFCSRIIGVCLVERV
jgi:hypothetical protein